MAQVPVALTAHVSYARAFGNALGACSYELTPYGVRRYILRWQLAWRSWPT
jgi:hypothetical protein